MAPASSSPRRTSKASAPATRQRRRYALTQTSDFRRMAAPVRGSGVGRRGSAIGTLLLHRPPTPDPRHPSSMTPATAHPALQPLQQDRGDAPLGDKPLVRLEDADR